MAIPPNELNLDEVSFDVIIRIRVKDEIYTRYEVESYGVLEEALEDIGEMMAKDGWK